MAGLSKVTLEYEKRGRLIRDDQHREAIRARAAAFLNMNGAGGGSSSTSSLYGSGGVASREVVLKVVNWSKSQHSPLAQARYASRTRSSDLPEHALPMQNEKCELLHGREIDAEIRSWELKPDRENLSKKARSATAAERLALPVNERLNKRQAAHIIFSIPGRGITDPKKLDGAVSGALQETVGRGGYRYVYTIHTEHGARPHAHIIVKATSEPFRGRNGRQTTRQLRIGTREIDAMRQVFARHAQEQGLSVTATRRIDRPHVRQEILEGRAPLRENKTLHQGLAQTRQGRAFEKTAPHWYQEHGFGYERRRLAAVITPAAPASSPDNKVENPPRGFLARMLGTRPSARAPEPSSPDNSPVPQKSAGYFMRFRNYREGRANAVIPSKAQVAGTAVERHFAAVTRDPVAATERFEAMIRELERRGRGMGLALWAANNHPIAFGEPTGNAGPGLTRKSIQDVVSKPSDSSLDRIRADLVVAGEIAAIREATHRARSERQASKAGPILSHHVAGLARRIEHETPNDPDVRSNIQQIRSVSQQIGDPQRFRSRDGAAATGSKGERYAELEQRIRQRDKARSGLAARDRDDGGRSR